MAAGFENEGQMKCTGDHPVSGPRGPPRLPSLTSQNSRFIPNMQHLGASCPSALSTTPACKCLVTLEARSQQRLVWAACPEHCPIVLNSQAQSHVPRAHDAWAALYSASVLAPGTLHTQ